ncbi:MAG: competence protein ComK [Bacilli bacterium]|nr:competence protein ComK [Bacilli bacterium]
MEKYEINSKTMAIIPITSKVSHIIEEDNEFFINQNSFDIVDKSCKYFGSSYEGRHIGTISMLGISYKTPILVEETQNIITFPTLTPRDEKCCWIFLNKIEKYMKNDKLSMIQFKNGYTINLDISYGSLENQILRSTMLDFVIRKRRK